MREHLFAAINEGMEVCDLNGDKVGKVGKKFHSTTGSVAEPMEQAHLQIKTGFLGLGKDLFIPGSAISDVAAERVMLNVEKDRVDAMGWNRRPDWLRGDEA
jgi:hypothetical protein